VKKAKHESKRLTDVELELMTILWRLGEGTVNEVIEQLPRGRELAYTSVSTILRILEQKEILRTRKASSGHIYIPAMKKAEFEATTVQDIVERVFDGTPVALVRQLLGAVKMNADEIEELKKILNQKESEE